MKTELSMSAEDLTSGRAQIIDDDDDDHDDHDDSDKINDAEGMDPERLKAFNVSRLFSAGYRPCCVQISYFEILKMRKILIPDVLNTHFLFRLCVSESNRNIL